MIQTPGQRPVTVCNDRSRPLTGPLPDKFPLDAITPFFYAFHLPPKHAIHAAYQISSHWLGYNEGTPGPKITHRYWVLAQLKSAIGEGAKNVHRFVRPESLIVHRHAPDIEIKNTMGKPKLHLHSMMVHAVIALAPLAATTYLLWVFNVRFLTFTPETWQFLTIFALVALLLLSVPSALLGVFERGHQYVNWHFTHKIKLALTVVLGGFLIVELIWLIGTGLDAGSVWLPGVLIVLGNTGLAMALSAFGLKMTLGRQSLGGTSYEPDLFKTEPVDILVSAGVLMKEEPKYVDLLEER